MTKTPNHGARTHARMSPSTAHQWVHCAAWLALTADLPETPSGKAAQEGTLAHEWADFLLRSNSHAKSYIGLALPDRGKGSELSAEMARHVQFYLDTVRSEAAGGVLQVESRVSLAVYFGDDDGDGTTDGEIYIPAEKHLKIVDLKYGAGQMIDARNNPQELEYCLGSFERYRRQGVSKITLIIVQPRAYDERLKRWEIDPLDLMSWGETVRDLVSAQRQVAAAHAKMKNADKFATPGDHCRYCKANYWGMCPALKAKTSAVASDGFTAAPVIAAQTVSPDDLGARLRDLPALQAYCKALEDRAELEARAGRMPSGFKWTQSSGHRKWTNADEAAEKLAAIVSDPRSPGKLKTPAEIEKEIGKKAFAAELGFLVESPKTYNISPIDSPKPAVTPPFLAESGF